MFLYISLIYWLSYIRAHSLLNYHLTDSVKSRANRPLYAPIRMTMDIMPWRMAQRPQSFTSTSNQINHTKS